MRIKAFATDVDGVITKIESAWRYIHERLNLLEKAKLNAELYYSRKISYRKWAELDIELWKGISKEQFYSLLEAVEIREGAEELFSYLRSKGIKIIAISGGLTSLLEILSRKFHFDKFMANDIIFENNIICGKFKLNVTPYNKGKILLNFLKKLGIDNKECLGLGDSEFDIPMLKVCGYRITFKPKNLKLIQISNEAIFSDTLHEVYMRIRKLVDQS